MERIRNPLRVLAAGGLPLAAAVGLAFAPSPAVAAPQPEAAGKAAPSSAPTGGAPLPSGAPVQSSSPVQTGGAPIPSSAPGGGADTPAAPSTPDDGATVLAAPPPCPPLHTTSVVVAAGSLDVTAPQDHCIGTYRARFIFQADGNLVLYDELSRVRFASNTRGRGYRLVFQTDGNLVVYNVAGNPVYASNTAGHPGAVLAVQTDGNVVIYWHGRAIWATNSAHGGIGSGAPPPCPPLHTTSVVVAAGSLDVTAPRNHCIGTRKARFIFQGDGNLVVYDENGAARFASNTRGRGYRLVFQGDGNLVVYDIAGDPVYASNTAGHPDAVLAVQTDGNVVIYWHGRAIWATNTRH